MLAKHSILIRYSVLCPDCLQCICTDVRDDEGKSPMDRAVLGVYDSCVNVALYLMSRGYACSDEDKANLLCGVCWTGRLDMVEELVEHHKVDPESECDDLP